MPMPDHDMLPESQIEMVRLLASIQASQKFMSDTLVEIKDDVKETKEATQGHALLIANVRMDVEVLRTRLNNHESLFASHMRAHDVAAGGGNQVSSNRGGEFNGKNLSIFGGLAAVTYGLIEVIKMLINYFTFHAPKT